MNNRLSAPGAVYRLLAATWDPGSLPAPEEVPWHDVLCLVGPSNIAALVYALAHDLRPFMPDHVRSAFEQAFYQTAAANLRCLHQLAEVDQALRAAGAATLLLKGAALAEALYPDPALRLIGDIDLAIQPEQLGACRQALLSKGYLPSRIEERPGSLLAHSNQELFDPPAPHAAGVELHWHILDVPYYMQRISMAWFWENSEELAIAGRPYRVLNAEANLIHLSAHLALHHRFEGLHSMLDLALLIVSRGPRLDWDKVIETAHAFELVGALSGTLDRLSQAWPSLPLDEPRARLRALTPSAMDTRLFRLLSSEAHSPTSQFYAKLVTMPGLAGRIRYVGRNLFPQPAYMRERYGIRARWHLPYWYLYRLFDGLRRLSKAQRDGRVAERTPAP